MIYYAGGVFENVHFPDCGWADLPVRDAALKQAISEVSVSLFNDLPITHWPGDPPAMLT